MCDIHVTNIILDSNFLGPQNFLYPKIVLTHTFLIPIFLLISFWNQYPTQLKSQVWLSQLSLLSSSFKLQLSCTETATLSLFPSSSSAASVNRKSFKTDF